MPAPRGPAADPKFPLSIESSNPYGLPQQVFEACRLPPKVTDEYVFFTGHEGPWDETCFSQWFPAPFFVPRDASAADKTLVELPTAEHYMMYKKALLMGDLETAEKILAEPHPSVAKQLGREVKGFDRGIWRKNADRVVEEGNQFKFSQNPDLMAALLATGNRMLVESCPEDRIWGIGLNANDALGRESEWGDNRVGKALMKVRDRLRQQDNNN